MQRSKNKGERSSSWVTNYHYFKVYAGDEFDEYVPPFSFKLNAAGDGVVEDGTPLHAILFLVYKQPGRWILCADNFVMVMMMATMWSRTELLFTQFSFSSINNWAGGSIQVNVKRIDGEEEEENDLDENDHDDDDDGDGVVEDGTPLHAIPFLVYKQLSRWRVRPDNFVKKQLN